MGLGRNRPNKSEFPAGWSDDQAIEAIKDVASDSGSSGEIEPDDRIESRRLRVPATDLSKDNTLPTKQDA